MSEEGEEWGLNHEDIITSRNRDCTCKDVDITCAKYLKT